jgi:hypothetical protein
MPTRRFKERLVQLQAEPMPVRPFPAICRERTGRQVREPFVPDIETDLNRLWLRLRSSSRGAADSNWASGGDGKLRIDGNFIASQNPFRHRPRANRHREARCSPADKESHKILPVRQRAAYVWFGSSQCRPIFHNIRFAYFMSVVEGRADLNRA